tara:strand:- start:135 stop:242 length:108 start_codon:yes stop_codon:yes gene_type:complete
MLCSLSKRSLDYYGFKVVIKNIKTKVLGQAIPVLG